MAVHYTISYQNPATQYMQIEVRVEGITSPEIYARISAWRPGRYELGNFARNIRSFTAANGQGMPLHAEKTEREKWKIETGGADTVVVRYELYAGTLTAGSTFLDASQLYMNPVNALCYIEGREEDTCYVDLMLPADYRIATGLAKVEGKPHSLMARNFDQLADCPLIASNSLRHFLFPVDSLDVHLWFQGECKPDEERLRNDFTRFIREQVHAFGDFPEKEYHFLFQITPHKTHHGVEHENSTVCMIGPTYQLFGSSYDEFIGLSSHEFYHSWNIKKIRPVEMLPYDFTGENYFRTGYVAEGVTTYYGDLMPYRARVYSQAQYFATLKDLLQKHFHNYARLVMPVAEASFDMWIDGYEPGAPHRKTSIYNEGALCALMADLTVISSSGHRYSLDDVMKALYTEFAQQGKGYTTADYRMLLERYADVSFEDYFRDYVYGTQSYEEGLRQALGLAGLEIRAVPSNELYERNFGFKVGEDSNKVLNIAPGSPAYQAGLMIGEVVASVNGFSLNGNLRQWFNYFKEDEIQLRVRTTDNRIRHITMPPCQNNYFMDYSVIITAEPTDEQVKVFERWTRNSLLVQR